MINPGCMNPVSRFCMIQNALLFAFLVMEHKQQFCIKTPTNPKAKITENGSSVLIQAQCWEAFDRRCRGPPFRLPGGKNPNTWSAVGCRAHHRERIVRELKHSASLPELSLWLLAPPNVVKISAVLRLAAGLSQRSREGCLNCLAPKANTLLLFTYKIQGGKVAHWDLN